MKRYLGKGKRWLAGILAGLLILTPCSSLITSAEEGIELATDGVEAVTEGGCAHTATALQNVVQATCSSAGYSGDTVCTQCGTVVLAGTATAALAHTWNAGQVVTEAKCESQGEKVYTCTVCGATTSEVLAALGHDKKLIEYKKPTTKAEGYEKTQCTRCKKEFTDVLPKIEQDDPVYEYEDSSGATANSLTFYVGYFGMEFVKKETYSLSEIQNSCSMVTQTFSYLNRRPAVVYDVATGPLLSDVLGMAGIDSGSIQGFLFATADSGGNYYDANGFTYGSLYSGRYCYPRLGEYFNGVEITDRAAAGQGASAVEPMLAIWDSWITYGEEQEFNMAQHTSHMKSGNCFRLLFGQTVMDEVEAASSAKWINTIYVRYTGSPKLDAGDDLDLKIDSDYKMTASVSTVDQKLTEVFSSAVKWSSSDESVVKIDPSSGQVTVVGEGTATITATAKVEGVSSSDSVTVTVSDEESLGSGGSGGGNGSGNGNGRGDGDGDGAGNGDGTGGTGKDKGRGEDVDGAEQVELGNELVIAENGQNKIKAIPLRAKSGAAGTTSGGSGGEITLIPQEKKELKWMALIAISIFVAGGAATFIKFKSEI